MRTTVALAALASLFAVALSGCSSGPVKRVSEPAAQIQQITVRSDGRWDVQLRLQNYSSIPMRFDAVALQVTSGGESAAELRASPGVGIGPESADVVSITAQPTVAAKLAVADALASRRPYEYALKGTVTATPEGKSSRSFNIERRGELNPAPGLPGVLR